MARLFDAHWIFADLLAGAILLAGCTDYLNANPGGAGGPLGSPMAPPFNRTGAGNGPYGWGNRSGAPAGQFPTGMPMIIWKLVG
ncbi:MAG: hypothetical protein V1728_02055 [Candidatus Micrarchaeota archaeon]